MAYVTANVSTGEKTLSQLIFATSQPATEFPTEGINGKPDNFSIFLFFSEQDFLNRQHNIWEDTKHKYNCTRSDYEALQKYIGTDFLVTEQGLVVNTDSYINEKLYESGRYDDFKPHVRVFFLNDYSMNVLVSIFDEKAERILCEKMMRKERFALKQPIA